MYNYTGKRQLTALRGILEELSSSVPREDVPGWRSGKEEAIFL